MIINGPIAIESVPSVPWKNGGGTTRTLAVEPEGAGLDNFIWRISLAEIHVSGSFSAFPGIDRTILLWRGEGVVLSSPAWPDHALVELRLPFSFLGEEKVTCQLLGESTADLNIMVQRGAAVATIRTETTEVKLTDSCDDIVIFCAAGDGYILLPDSQRVALNEGLFLRVSNVDDGITIVPEGMTAVFVCAILHSLTDLATADNSNCFL